MHERFCPIRYAVNFNDLRFLDESESPRPLRADAEPDEILEYPGSVIQAAKCRVPSAELGGVWGVV